MKKAGIAELTGVLFALGGVVSWNKLGAILGTDKARTKELAQELALKLESDKTGGLMLARTESGAGLLTKPGIAETVLKAVKEDLGEELSEAALMTLALIAYGGPLSRIELDYLRGVNSSFILRNLTARGLAERTPLPSAQGVYLYHPGAALFRHLGIAQAGDLPDYAKNGEMIRNFLKRGESQNQNEHVDKA